MCIHFDMRDVLVVVGMVWLRRILQQVQMSSTFGSSAKFRYLLHEINRNPRITEDIGMLSRGKRIIAEEPLILISAQPD